MADGHRWIVFIHVLAGFGFFLAHGASAAVVFRLRREDDPARIKALLQLSRLSTMPAGILGLVLIIAGVWAGIDLSEWTSGRWWLWTALLLLILVIVAMYLLISRHYYPLRERLDKDDIPPDELRTIIANPQPMLGAWIGIAGMVVIVWLMMFRPF